MPDSWFINGHPSIDPATGRYRESTHKPGQTTSGRYLENSLRRIAVYAGKPTTRDKGKVALYLRSYGHALQPTQRELLELYCRS